MDTSNDSFLLARLNPGPQTPGSNKRMRSEGQNSIDNHTRIIQVENSAIKYNDLNHEELSMHQNDYPPIIIDFKTSHNKTDRKLIEELITDWKTKNNTEINVIGRFGYKKLLLVFARDRSTLDDLLNQKLWPNKIGNDDYIVKYPKILPEMYSLVILDFQITWKEDETLKDLQEKYSTMIKLTRIVNRNGKSLNIVRADFRSSETVKQLLQQGEIDINSMKLRIRPYFSPVKINKCRKCFKHDHRTSQCNSPQLCFKCGQHHAFEGGCKNEIRCVNCQQHHYSGHSSCPVVQQKRKQIAEQQKIHRAELLINQQRQQNSYKYNPSLFPPLLADANSSQYNTRRNLPNSNYQLHNQPSYASVVAIKDNNKHENIEQLMMAITESINQQLSIFSTTITTQICDLALKINTYNDRVQTIEQQIEKVIIPAISEISKIIDNHIESKEQFSTQKTNQHCQITSCQKIIQSLIQKQQTTITQIPRYKSQRSTKNLIQIQSNSNNDTQ